MKTKIEKKLSVDWYKKSSRKFLELSKNYTRSRQSLKKTFIEKQHQGYSGRTERNKSMNLKVGDFHVNQRLYKSLGFTYCFFGKMEALVNIKLTFAKCLKRGQLSPQTFRKLTSKVI